MPLTREEYNKYCNAYYHSHKEYWQFRYQMDKERINAVHNLYYRNIYYPKNKDKINEYHNLYYRNIYYPKNKDRLCAYQRVRYKRKKEERVTND